MKEEATMIRKIKLLDAKGDGLLVILGGSKEPFMKDFDDCLYFKGSVLTLAEFFDTFGITEKDCQEAFVELAISKN